MRSTVRVVAALASAACLIAPSAAQTYTNCNPTSSSSCPADSALGKTVNIDFSSESESFTPQGSPTYDSNGVSFTVAKSGDSPQLTSKWYIMFGRVDVSLKAAPGKGIVSSFVLQSDDLDEIDWEWLGADSGQVQSNYFGKGQTTTYNRGAFHANPDNQAGFKTYSIQWTPEQIIWQIDGTTVRTLEPANANDQYPQTPMQIKVGAWSGGDSANAPGTIEWAQGPTDYSQGPFTMQVKSLKVQDYSTGTQYVYGDQTGTWQSIKSTGGTIYAGGSVPTESDSPAVTSSTNGQPAPFDSSETSTVVKTGYPWVADSSTLATATATYANYPGLPSGWTVSDSGKVVPPSSAPATSLPASSTPYSAPSPSASSGGSEQVVTAYDQQGFTTVYTVAAGSSVPTSTVSALENNKLESDSASPTVSSAYRLLVNSGLALLATSIGVLSIIL
ncbi:glycoside hydrolase family 16 protein [Lophiostoma macrostomum CBS 122681]|uniref:Crh-like protein n=1 Tax=Lophiostoma macrostomum CBS 122681 TaxID=1314788 RepID=A0A6A6TPH3_9PLEO|nr:glycoside hydrolase family 16 protein [Lophiostoma macrostomum CBS 122681]